MKAMPRRVIEQYEFLRKIGSGGSGVVFLANDTLLQRPVVLKLLKRGSADPRAGAHHPATRGASRVRDRSPQCLRDL